MNQEEYLKLRVEDQINWYDNSSRKNKRWFVRLKAAEIILALCIPFLGNFISDKGNTFIVVMISVIGLSIAAIAGLLSLFRLQENWIEYRSTAEVLKHEKFLFLGKAGIYAGSNAFELFVERIEGMISKETSNWGEQVKKEKTEK